MIGEIERRQHERRLAEALAGWQSSERRALRRQMDRDNLTSARQAAFFAARVESGNASVQSVNDRRTKLNFPDYQI